MGAHAALVQEARAAKSPPLPPSSIGMQTTAVGYTKQHFWAMMVRAQLRGLKLPTMPCSDSQRRVSLRRLNAVLEGSACGDAYGAWHFASAENRDAFAAAPERFAPQYGGFCAWAVAARKKLYSTQPENWTIEAGKLYLNYNDNIQEEYMYNGATTTNNYVKYSKQICKLQT